MNSYDAKKKLESVFEKVEQMYRGGAPYSEPSWEQFRGEQIEERLATLFFTEIHEGEVCRDRDGNLLHVNFVILVNDPGDDVITIRYVEDVF